MTLAGHARQDSERSNPALGAFLRPDLLEGAKQGLRGEVLLRDRPAAGLQRSPTSRIASRRSPSKTRARPRSATASRSTHAASSSSPSARSDASRSGVKVVAAIGPAARLGSTAGGAASAPACGGTLSPVRCRAARGLVETAGSRARQPFALAGRERIPSGDVCRRALLPRGRTGRLASVRGPVHPDPRSARDAGGRPGSLVRQGPPGSPRVLAGARARCRARAGRQRDQHRLRSRRGRLDARGDAINDEAVATWRSLPIDELLDRARTIPGELRGHLTVVPEARWLKNGELQAFFTSETIDHYADHAANLAVILAAVR